MVRTNGNSLDGINFHKKINQYEHPFNLDLIDARKTDKSLKCEQNIIRKRIYGKNGDASRKSKKTIRMLKAEARSKKKELKIKFSKKIEHLQKRAK